MNPFDVAIGSTQTYTMRELNQHTADVMREINESGKPAAITRRGRFIALILPLADNAIEAVTLAQMLEVTENHRQLTGEHTASSAATAEEVADELGVIWRP